jgi:phage terminase large subunit GpA-like protein
MLFPSEKLGEYTSTNRIQPMFSACEAVRKKKTANGDDYTTLEMRFQDSVLSIAGGGSASQTMSRPVRYLFRDETDELKAGVGTDATDPLKSSEETTSNFGNRKIVDTSTPTKITGNIWRQLGTCQYVFEYWVPCLSCGSLFVILCGERDGELWGNIDVHGETDPEAAATVADLRCPHCGEHMKNHQKGRMLEGGQWRARTTPDVLQQLLDLVVPDIAETVALEGVLGDPGTRKIGFHLPKWYSPFAHGTFGDCAREWMHAQGDFLKMAEWSKFWAARPYTESIEGAKIHEAERHANAMTPKIVPDDAICVTSFLDPGQKGFWWTSWAWLPNKRMHLVDYGHRSLIGKSLDEKIEIVRGHVFDTRYVSEMGNKEFPIWRAGMDTGGGKVKHEPMTMTAQAYAIIRGVVRAQMKKETSPELRRLVEKRFLATKGDTGTDKAMRESKIDRGPDGKPIPGGFTLWIMNVDMLKSAFAFAFNLEPEKHGSVSLHGGNVSELIAHISAEELQQDKKGKWSWVQKPRTENHLLDCTVGAWGVGARECMGGVEGLRRQQSYKIEKPPEEKTADAPETVEAEEKPEETKPQPRPERQRPRPTGWFRRGIR